MLTLLSSFVVFAATTGGPAASDSCCGSGCACGATCPCCEGGTCTCGPGCACCGCCK